MYSEAPEIEVIANKLIDNMKDLSHIKVFDIDIGYLFSDIEKKQSGHEVLAEIIQVGALLGYYCTYDFIVIVYEPNVIDLTEAQMQILLYHELLHINDDGKLIGHTVQDFKTIINKYGIDWDSNKDLQPIVGGDSVGKKNKTGGRKTSSSKE